jgi:predicted DNA-binding transcriptional regulator AlpA
MNGANANERLMQFLQATPEQRERIHRILDGTAESLAPAVSGPLLLGMSAGATLLGVSRATLWRMIKVGKVTKVEVLPGSFRVRRADIEAIAGAREVSR